MGEPTMERALDLLQEIELSFFFFTKKPNQMVNTENT